MTKYIVSLESGADYEVTKQTIEKQGGTVVDDSARFLGMITVQMSDEDALSLKSLNNNNIISVEPDQEVTIQPST
ncbi:hypothetical protein BD769DRAFT_1659787 [Suillus cothurnatus]|jgi:hypothetical protein|nr:hypothetical protein BD769DRAFT_1659787 [Suillus cothurnatus]